MFGAGYAGAEDRLFFMDALRNVGRGTLSTFAGGAAGNRAMDEDIWSQAPYTESDFQRQYDDFDNLYGAEGAADPAGRGRTTWRASRPTSPRRA